MLQYYIFNFVLEKQMIYLCIIISLYSCLGKKKRKKPKSHWNGICYRFPAIRQTIPFLSAPELQQKMERVMKKESKRGKRREWKAGEGIDKWEKNVLFLFHELMKKDKTRYKAEYSALCYGQITESSHAHNAHIWERNVGITISISWIFYWIQCLFED